MSDPNEFVAALNAAFSVGSPGKPAQYDAPSMIPPPARPPSEEPVVNNLTGLLAWDFRVRRRVFTLFRPDCFRCAKEAEAAAGTDAPLDPDRECPHNDIKVYEEIINATLSGETVFGSETETVQKDGTVIISVKWYEKIPRRPKPSAGV